MDRPICSDPEANIMDWSLIIFSVVVVFFTYRGYKRGFLRSLSRISSLVASYIACTLYTARVAAMVETYTQLQGIVAFFTAALVLFITVGVAVSLLFRLVEELRFEREALPAASSFGGAALGLVVGLIVAFTLVWVSALARDIYLATAPERRAQSNQSSIEMLANGLAGKAVAGAMALVSARPEVASLSAALIESPAEFSQHVQQLALSGDLKALLSDPENQVVLDSGDARAVQALPAFQQLVNNPHMLALANSAGMLDDSANDSGRVDAVLARQITDIWTRTQQVKNDRRVQEILGDAEFQQKLQSGNPLDLLTNAGLLELADIIFSDSAAPDNSADKIPDGSLPETPKQPSAKKGTLIYSWTDKQGRVHYSDIDNKP